MMRFKTLTISVFALALVAADSDAIAVSGEYVSGHGALELWDEAARDNVPVWLRVWLRFLILTFAAGLFFVRSRKEARWAVGGLVGVIATATMSQAWTDIVPLSGFIALLHIVFWSPVLYLLVTRRPFLKDRSLYGAWSGLLTVVILFSFIFDFRDAAIYLDHVFGLGILS
ncbi:MAG: hypothetical protein AAFY69_06320 [Pseudomonadota bacterium]